MTKENENLQENEQEDIIDTGNASEAGAADSTAEDTLTKLFEQSQSQVAQLIEQNKSLQNQISLLLRNGAVTSSSADESTPAQTVGNMTQSQIDYKQSDDYVSLADLGREFGKREYRNENMN